jgi:hypothetical protein
VVSEQEQAAELPERWSAKAKTDVVLRLLRGEGVEAVSREVQVPAHEPRGLAADVSGGRRGGLEEAAW